MAKLNDAARKKIKEDLAELDDDDRSYIKKLFDDGGDDDMPAWAKKFLERLEGAMKGDKKKARSFFDFTS